jgi:histidine phosphotransferase ChpT
MDDMMPPDRQSLADLIGSRLCHDLSNPLGAIGNGVELLDLTGSAKGPEMDLIRDAVGDALARVRFFRLAFGHAGPDHMTSAREARTTLEALYAGGRIAATWKPLDDMPRRQVKLAYLMMLCAETALPMGGDVTLSMEPGGQWSLTASAERITVEDGLWSILRFGPGTVGRELRPADVQFLALHELAEGMSRTINYVHDETNLRLSTA